MEKGRNKEKEESREIKKQETYQEKSRKRDRKGKGVKRSERDKKKDGLD